MPHYGKRAFCPYIDQGLETCYCGLNYIRSWAGTGEVLRRTVQPSAEAQRQPAHLKLGRKLAGEAQLAQADAVVGAPHADGPQQICSTSIPRWEPRFLHARRKAGLMRCGCRSCLGSYPFHGVYRWQYKAPSVCSVDDVKA